MSNRMLNLRVSVFIAFAFLTTSVIAEEATSATAEAGLEIVPADTLDVLLQNVQDRRVVESKDNVRREREFVQRKSSQQTLLNNAKAEKRREERRSERLETKFEENEIRIGNLQEQLDNRFSKFSTHFGANHRILHMTLPIQTI